MAARTLRTVLALSIGLNAFLAAAFAASLIVETRLAARVAPAPALRVAARTLDAPHHAAFLAMLRADGKRLRPQNLQARTLRRGVWAALQAPAFDPARAKADLARARALNSASRAVVEEDVVDFAAALPIDQRAALGRALESMTSRPKIARLNSGAASPNPAPGSSRAPRSPA